MNQSSTAKNSGLEHWRTISLPMVIETGLGGRLKMSDNGKCHESELPASHTCYAIVELFSARDSFLIALRCSNFGSHSLL